MSLHVGIDIGTSACRVAIIDADGTLLTLARAALPAVFEQGVICEQLPDEWWRACQNALSSALTEVDKNRVASIAIAGTSSSVLLCDATGNALTPGLMYRDQRAGKQAAQLADLAPETAAVHSPSSSLAKLLWWQQHGNLLEGSRLLHQADWLCGKLGGYYEFSDENNALKLGYDPVSRSWPGWLSAFALPADCLPAVVPAGQRIGPVLAEIATQFGLPANCQLVAGTTDSTATFMASGASQIGDAVSILGSTLVIKILGDRPVFAPEYGVYSHRLGEQWLIGGASNAGGAVLRQFFNDEQLVQLSAQIHPEQFTELNYLPLPATGERFPVNDPRLEPILLPRPDDDIIFLQGMLEGISKIEQRGYARLAELGAPLPTSIRTSGGGAKNSAWQDIRQRLLGIPILAADHDEAAVGAARLASQAWSK